MLAIHQGIGIGVCQKMKKRDRKIVEVTDSFSKKLSDTKITDRPSNSTLPAGPKYMNKVIDLFRNVMQKAIVICSDLMENIPDQYRMQEM